MNVANRIKICSTITRSKFNFNLRSHNHHEDFLIENNDLLSRRSVMNAKV